MLNWSLFTLAKEDRRDTTFRRQDLHYEALWSLFNPPLQSKSIMTLCLDLMITTVNWIGSTVVIAKL